MAAYAICCTTVLLIILCIVYPGKVTQNTMTCSHVMPSLFSSLMVKGISAVISLSLESWCICNGYAATFECVVTGADTTTIWQGTALQNCSDGNIILRRSQFSSENGHVINRTCGNGGLLVGQTISVINNNFYTSQLVITNLSQYLYGHTVECASGNLQSPNSSQVIFLTGKMNLKIVL